MSNSSNSPSSTVNEDAAGPPPGRLTEPSFSEGTRQDSESLESTEPSVTSAPDDRPLEMVPAAKGIESPTDESVVRESTSAVGDSVQVVPAALAALVENSLCGPLATVTDGLNRLEDLFEQKINRELHLNQIIDQLHADLQDQKRGLVRQILQPLAIDLITLYDDLSDRSEKYRGKGTQDVAASIVAQEADGTREEIEDILYRYGVQKYIVAEPQFNATRQRAIRLESTTDASLDGTTFLRRRCGFEYDGQVLRSEQVVVYRFDSATSVADQSAL